MFLAPVHWIVQSTLKISLRGVKIGCQSSIDLDYANDLALLTELLRIIAVPYSWFRCHECRGLLAGPVGELAKTKIQCKFYTETTSQFLIWFISKVQPGRGVNEFTYLGACTICDGSSESEILRRIGIARNCMTLLERHVWKSHIRVDTEMSVYGLEAWTITRLLLGDWMPLTHGHSETSFGYHRPTPDTLSMLLPVSK